MPSTRQSGPPEGRRSWTWEEVDEDWLQGSRLAVLPSAIVEAFNRVDALFGRDWIEGTRLHPGTVGPTRGTSPTLDIVALGQKLAVLDQAAGDERLIEKVRGHDSSALAELKAIYLTAGGLPDVLVECEPAVAIGGRERKPDFRVARDGGPWSYVEVTRPNPAAAQQQLEAAMHELMAVLKTVPGMYTAEVFFHRHARADELRAIKEQVMTLCAQGEAGASEMADDLGVIYINDAVPGQIELSDRGQPYVPRLGSASAVMEDGITTRHIAVRVPYFDDRGHTFLATEAAQLPETGPGLIMIDLTGASGGKEWARVLEGELALGLYRHVSAICLLRSGQVSTDEGEAVQVETKLISNPGATRLLPQWLSDELCQHESGIDQDPRPPESGLLGST